VVLSKVQTQKLLVDVCGSEQGSNTKVTRVRMWF